MQRFLSSLGQGLLPKRIQLLINGDNYGVPAQLVALDAISLLYEDAVGTEFILLSELLPLMKILSTKGCLRPSEHHSSQAPYFLMPIFFNKHICVSLNSICYLSILMDNFFISEFNCFNKKLLILHECCQ